MGDSLKNQIGELSRIVQEFARCIESLPESVFLKKMNGWMPRDVIAHLIGWNLYTIKGCQQLKRGELPFYFNDPGDDFCKVNDVSVRKYNTKDKKKLLKQLNDSLEKLKKFLVTVGPADWENDFRIRYKGYIITIKNTIDNMISDYIKHRQQINDWLRESK
jgi:hypothetical protein